MRIEYNRRIKKIIEKMKTNILSVNFFKNFSNKFINLTYMGIYFISIKISF
jgi:hypothetical protein